MFIFVFILYIVFVFIFIFVNYNYRTHPTPCTKINLKWLKDLNTRQHKILRTEHRQKILWHQLYRCFLRSVSQGNRKAKVNQWDLVKLTSFRTAKETINKTKRQTMECNKIVSNDATVKGLICKMHKQFIQLNSKTNQSN